MRTKVELLLTPAELEKLNPENLDRSTCVVLDILRATSTLVMALHHGAQEIFVVGRIEEALALRAVNPNLLLAGERGGKRILRSLTGSIDFDLGNSPREFTPAVVTQRSIVMTTTNGTRALLACQGASSVLAGSFLNLSATAGALIESPPERLLVICAGTKSQASYEDTLGAGALLSLLPETRFDVSADASLMAKQLYSATHNDLTSAFAQSINGRRLAADSELREDLATCATRDIASKPARVVGNVARF